MKDYPVPLDKYPGYYINKKGNIFHFMNTQRRNEYVVFIQNVEDRDGYHRVRMNKDGVRKVELVHQLVLSTFVGPRPSLKHQVCHKNGVRTDNRLENLYWGTAKENAADRTKHGNCKGAENFKKATDANRTSDKCRRGHLYTKIRDNGVKYCGQCKRINLGYI